tara:strand:- start:21505 stop:22158 length:654 start_codon:yes stop_codon:yes gene_type:complete
LKRTFNAAVVLSGLFLSGCAANQNVSEFEQAPPKIVCIAEHEAVKEGVRDALEEGFHAHGADTRVIRAIYEEKHNLWNPRIYPNELGDCDAIAFYVANWAWDISMYMYFANIWITDPTMSKKIAQATYQTGGGPDKWINARKKILELVDEMYESVEQQPGANQNSTTVAEQNSPNLPSAPDDADPALALQKLKDMYDKGLITESEYAAEKKEILDSL